METQQSNIGDNQFKRLSLLDDAIKSFNSAASSVEKYYQNLENQVRALDIELKYKNEELERNLKEKDASESYLHCILNSLTAGVIVIDRKNRITSFNRAAEQLTGFKAMRAMGKTLKYVFESDFFEELDLHLLSVAETGEAVQFETEMHVKKGNRYVSVCISPLQNKEGEKHGIALTLQDITRMKRLEERANRAGRLAAMGEMAANIAHEIRNPLGSIELFASLLKKDLENLPDAKALVEHISSGVTSINNIVSNMLLFIKPQQMPDFKVLDIEQLINDSLCFTDHMIRSINSINVVTEFLPSSLTVYGDRELLKQVVLNIVLNAIQAMPGGGRLVISVKRIKTRPGDPDLAEIKFADTGKGISKADIPMVFDPFFSTKKKGTGLGLAIVHNIVKLHNGTIDISSTKGKGTVCVIRLPVWKGMETSAEFRDGFVDGHRLHDHLYNKVKEHKNGNRTNFSR